MSLFNSAEAPCPSCGAVHTFSLAASVNGGRRPDLRDEILTNAFQVQTCGQCKERFRPPPRMTYVDVGRHDWIIVRPSDEADEWPPLEAQARSTFEKAYGARAPLAARELGLAMRARAAFGWSGLREKLLCSAHGLDDVELELTKLAVIRATPDGEVATGKSLRLIEIGDEHLVLAWFDMEDDQPGSGLQVPRSAYDDIAAEFDAWQALRARLAEGPYVDLNRFFVEAES